MDRKYLVSGSVGYLCRAMEKLVARSLYDNFICDEACGFGFAGVFLSCSGGI